jgi:hypothetical protein
MKKLGGLRDVFKHSKRRRPCQIFCPRCASPKIALVNSIGSLEIWLTPKQYYCSECGYHGILVMELEPTEEHSTDNKTEAIENKSDSEK